MLNQQKQANNSISFSIEVDDVKAQAKNPEIRKKFEEASAKAAQGPQITLEQISEKLKRAEEKRRQSLITLQGSVSMEERRRNAAQEKKKSLDRSNLDQIKERLEKGLNKAGEKRLNEREQRQ